MSQSASRNYQEYTHDPPLGEPAPGMSDRIDVLLARARRPGVRVWAKQALFEARATLEFHRYGRSNGSLGLVRA